MVVLFHLSVEEALKDDLVDRTPIRVSTFIGLVILIRFSVVDDLMEDLVDGTPKRVATLQLSLDGLFRSVSV